MRFNGVPHFEIGFDAAASRFGENGPYFQRQVVTSARKEVGF